MRAYFRCRIRPSEAAAVSITLLLLAIAAGTAEAALPDGNFSDIDMGFNGTAFANGTWLYAGKYVEFMYGIKNNEIVNYSVNGTVWFKKVAISNFSPQFAGSNGTVAVFEQGGVIGKSHNIRVESHDDPYGVMLIGSSDKDIYRSIRERLLAEPDKAIAIRRYPNGSITMKPEIIKNSEGKFSWLLDLQEKLQLPVVTFELADGVQVTKVQYGYRLITNCTEAYLFNSNYIGGTTNFSFGNNTLKAELKNSMIILRSTPLDNLNRTVADLVRTHDTVLYRNISNGTIRAEVDIDGQSSNDTVVYGDNLNISVKSSSDRIDVHVNATTHEGRVISINLFEEYYNQIMNSNYTVKVDDMTIYPADSYEDILNLSDDGGRAEYLLVVSDRAQFLVSVPRFSEHVISIAFREKGFLGSMFYVSLIWLMVTSVAMYLLYIWNRPVIPVLERFALWFLIVLRRLAIYIVRVTRQSK